MAVIHDYPAEKARGAVIVLHKPWQRVVFMAGLFGGVLLLLIALFLPAAH